MKERIAPRSVAAASGSYSLGVKVSCKHLIFVAGQVPKDKRGRIVGVDSKDRLRSPIDLAAQVRQTLMNVKAVVEDAGGSLDDIVRLDTYVAVSAMNEYKKIGRRVRSQVLGRAQPPGATVFVAGLMSPDALIEISAIAAVE